MSTINEYLHHQVDLISNGVRTGTAVVAAGVATGTVVYFPINSRWVLELTHMSITPRHVPVLADRVLALLAPALNQPNAVLIDATLGHGGHSELALNAFPKLTVIGLDRDLNAIRLSTERLAQFGSRIILVHAVYDQISEVLDQHNLDGAQGILFDLGVSSHATGSTRTRFFIFG